MADETSTNQADTSAEQTNQTPDPNQNLKAEFSRKFENISETLNRLSQSLDALKPKAAPAPASASKKVSELIYEDADAAAELIEQRAEERVMKRIDAKNELSQTFTALYSDYPELTEQDSDLTKKTVEYLKSYPESQRQDPRNIKLAARDAAADLGVMPKSKRGGSNDNYSFGGSGSGRNSNPPKPRESEEDSLIKEIATAFGRDPEKVMKHKRSSDREWLGYQPTGNKNKK